MKDEPAPGGPRRDPTPPISRPPDQLHPAEGVKAASNYLRGSIAAGLQDPVTGALPGDAPQILKFHGIYQQDDRDLREERRHQKLEPAFEFMVRLRLPGGLCQPGQWLQLDDLARRYGNGSLRLTSRQTFQFHGVRKKDLKAFLQGVHAAGLDSIGACGDGNRTVVCSPRPGPWHAPMLALARAVSRHLLPRSRAYGEIWLDEPAGGPPDEEPIYGPTYLPRKFKIGFVAPPLNDVDIYAQDLGFVAIPAGEELAGFNVCVGGGMGRTDHELATYPRLADLVGFCLPRQVVEVAEKTVTIQRDYGDRGDRKHARFKYTLDDRGLDWFRAELARRLGWALAEPRPCRFESNADPLGWEEAADGLAHYTLFIENGRLRGTMLEGLRQIARGHGGDFRLTANQNLMIAGIPAADRPRLARLLADHGLDQAPGALRRQAMACVALPTCGLAMAESERYLPGLVGRLEAVMAELGLADQAITIRMSGCPNGCSRPYIAEIGFSGRGPGTYNLYLGGGDHGQRLNCLFLENAGEEVILAALLPILGRYGAERRPGERFGDFVIRAGYVREVRSGQDFNQGGVGSGVGQ